MKTTTADNVESLLVELKNHGYINEKEMKERISLSRHGMPAAAVRGLCHFYKADNENDCYIIPPKE